MSEAPELSFIILTWNSNRYLPGCLDSIMRKAQEESIDFEVIIIDNGSRDETIKTIEQYQHSHPGIFHLIALPDNRGTTYPRNLGLKKARGEFICVLDSDTELAGGTLRSLLSHLTSNADIGIIAPRLLLPDGSVQHSVKRFPTMLDKLMKLPRIIAGIQTKNSDFYDDFPFTVIKEVDSAISACWFFQHKLLGTVGYLDENIFYAPEDLDYSLRVWQAGLKVLYYPPFTVLHHTQQLSHKKPLSKTSLSHFWGLIYYYCKHGGWAVRPAHKKKMLADTMGR